MESRKIAVVGGGYAGIAAARKLEDAGHRVDLYEQGVLGGRVVGLHGSNTCADPTVPILSANDREWVNCLIPGDFVNSIFPLIPLALADVNRGRVIFGSSRWNLADNLMRLRLRRLPFLMKRFRAHLHRFYPERSASLDDRSAGDFARLYFGNRARRRLVGPSFRADFAQDADSTSRCLFLLGRAGGLVQKFGTTKESLGVIAKRLAPSVARTGTFVSRVEQSQSGFALDLNGNDEGRRHYDALVVAIPGPAAARLVGDIVHSAERIVLEDTRYAPAVVLNAELRRPFLRTASLIRVPLEESGLIVRITVRPHDGVPDVWRLSAMVGTPSAQRLIDSSDDVVAARVREELEVLLPGLRSTFVNDEIERFQQGFPLFPVGRYRSLVRLRALEEERLLSGSNLVFAGDYLSEPNLAGAVLSGVRAARRLLVGLKV